METAALAWAASDVERITQTLGRVRPMLLIQRVAMAKPKRSVAAVVAERVKACRCLICDEEATELGLCSRHAQRFRSEMNKLPLDQREQFRAEMIHEGKVLAPHEVWRLKHENPFSRE